MTVEYYLGKKRKRVLKPIIFILLPAAAIVIFFLAVMWPLAIDAAEYRGKVVITQLLQETVIDALSPGIPYDKLVKINTDDGNRVTSIQVDSSVISILQASLTKDMNERLSGWGTEKTTLPLGTLTGIWLFNGRGPEISLYTAPISAVSSQVNHRFESAGINQTRHSIELEVSVDAQTLMLGVRTPFNVSTRIVLIDTIVVGVTPDVFAGMASGTYSSNIAK